ncbi:hypothetical protein ACE1AT_02885 [Pelatocladus sp. BLCC-F211]|uniref:hypothetical protein n=1 Tax=Pelatocladus sp. BLCC-F211 TaxID=3342752 RepID=UPI0035BB8098
MPIGQVIISLYNIKLKTRLQNPQKIKVGNVVLILYPEYVAGKTGVVCAREVIINEKMSDRWLIQVESENIVVSLNSDEFQLTSIH